MMSGLEMIETAEVMESTGIAELQEQREQLCAQAGAALESGNVERANYFQGEIAHLDELMARLEGGDSELSFGSKAGESMALKKADKEYAKHGNTSRYRQYLEEAAKEHRTPD